MARVSYVEEKDHPELAAEIGKIKGARGGLINIYKLLLHSPTVAMTWFEQISAIRWKTKLSPRLREIAIVRARVPEASQRLAAQAAAVDDGDIGLGRIAQLAEDHLVGLVGGGVCKAHHLSRAAGRAQTRRKVQRHRLPGCAAPGR